MKALSRAATTAFVAVALASPCWAGQVKLDIRGGQVTLSAKDATVREILAEWARVGQTRIVNAERIGGGLLTLDLNGVPEAKALDTVLRSVAGYVAAPRMTALCSVMSNRNLLLPHVVERELAREVAANGIAVNAVAPGFIETDMTKDMPEPALTAVKAMTPMGRLGKAEEVAAAVYRPCCDNPTLFPDCNHGMAMLGLLELMASKNASLDEMFTTAKSVNAFWFPQQALEIAVYIKQRVDGVQARDDFPRDAGGGGPSSRGG